MEDENGNRTDCPDNARTNVRFDEKKIPWPEFEEKTGASDLRKLSDLTGFPVETVRRQRDRGYAPLHWLRRVESGGSSGRTVRRGGDSTPLFSLAITRADFQEALRTGQLDALARIIESLTGRAAPKEED